MEPRQESSNVGSVQSATCRNISSPSSSSAFFSASQSPFFSPRVQLNARRAREKRAERRRGNPLLPPCSARHSSSDVYLGFHGRKPSLLRFAKWVRAELEIHGISCFAVDRARCKDSRSGDLAERAMRDAAYGVIILAEKSLANSHSVEELEFFLGRKNLVPVFFELAAGDCLARDVVERRGDVWEGHGGELWTIYGGDEKEWKATVDGLSRFEGVKIETREENWRDSVVQLVLLLAANLGRRSATERINRWRKTVEKEELPFPRKENFVGRKKELSEMELAFFGDGAEEEHPGPKARRRRAKGKESTFSGRGKGIVCVSGEPGMGKTELLLEYSYRFSQRYKTVLWVSGESRYLRQSYLNLRSFLEVDVSLEGGSSERARPRCFEEQEEEAMARVRSELSRDIPYLLVVDNLESEEDWFDRKSLIDLLPQFGGATHVVISTRLPQVMNLEPIKLSYLSAKEAMALMKGDSEEKLGAGEAAALRAMEEKLERMPLGLSIVGSILSELPISPSRLLDTINRTSSNIWRRRDGGDLFIERLLDLCLSIFHHAGGDLAARMLRAGCWFAPGPAPISLLALAAKKMPGRKSSGGSVFKTWASFLRLRRARRSEAEAEASSMLIRFGIARACTKPGCVCFHDYVKIFGDGAAMAAVQAITLRGSASLHPEQIWAACFLLLGFGAEPAGVELAPSELVLFVKRAALPLAGHSFFAFSRCGASLELLRLCTAALDSAADALICAGDNWQEGPVCCAGGSRGGEQRGMRLWKELGLLRAVVLETRAKLMLRGGLYSEADELVRKAIFIRESIFGENHPDTVAARETLARLTRLLNNARLG